MNIFVKRDQGRNFKGAGGSWLCVLVKGPKK